MKNLSTQIKKLKKILNLDENVLGVTFVDADSSHFANIYRDTACTAMARVLKSGEDIMLTADNQLCPGANYYLKFKRIETRDAIETYVKKERIFENNKVCKTFLDSLPVFPTDLVKKNIIVSSCIYKRTQVVVLLVNPAQANRLLGMLNFNQYKKVYFFPNQPTCISLYAPLVSGEPHINFIDYFDRYYQGKINKKNIWSDGKMIMSLSFADFKRILKNMNKTAQGSYKPNIIPQKIDRF